MISLTSEEKYDSLKFFDMQSIIEPVCEKCNVNNENCDGCLSNSCPFYSQITDILEHVYNAEQALKDAVKFAEEYDEYCHDMEIDIHRHVA